MCTLAAPCLLVAKQHAEPGLGRSSGMNSSCEFENSNYSRTRGGGFGELYTSVAISDQKSTEID